MIVKLSMNNYENFKLPADDEEKPYKWVSPDNAKVIDEEMVFKVAMTRDFKSMTELSLIAEKINFLNFGNSVLTKTNHLVKLDLSYN